jgi:hypothetical protein
VKIDFTDEIRPSKHFRNTWLRKWNWDMNELRSALLSAEIKEIGKTKYEAYVKDKKGGKKIIFAVVNNEIFIITGAEGK